MTQARQAAAVGVVSAATMTAAHRRDHHHDAAVEWCHPHAVEVIHLGDAAAVVCHDCARDSGFLPHREAETLARLHRAATAAGDAGLTDQGPRRFAA